MTFVRPLALFTSFNTKWTTTQEKAIARDYPFADLHLETPDQFVVRTYLQFLWLPESIVPIDLLIPSLHRVQDASSRPPDSPHPLHAFLDPLLLSVRSVVSKYHTELPQFIALGGGDGEVEESMMWYALNHEMGEGPGANSEDAVMLEEKSRNMWFERLEKREVQIQILLYFLKLSLPGPCTPLPPVTVPANDVVPSTKKKRKKERTKVITPTAQERLESFMDKLSVWQLVINMSDLDKRSDKTKHDWTRAFCENVVEHQFKSTLPDMCALLRNKLFPHSPFEDEEDDSDSRSSHGSQVTGRPNPNRKLTRTSTSASISQSKGKPNPKPLQRSSSVLSGTTASDVRSRSRSLSVSLAQDVSARRSSSVSGTSTSLKRALSREVSMSRGFKPRVQPSQASQLEATRKVPAKAKKEAKDSQGVTLVAATPTKPKVRKDTRYSRLTTSQSRSRVISLEHEDEGIGGLGDDDSDGLPDREEDEELWLPIPSPEVILLGARKRASSGSSSSWGLSDPTEEGVDTPAKKRIRI